MQNTLITLDFNLFQKKYRFKGNKNITTNIFRIQAYNSVMCSYFCIGFIDFMLKCRSFLEYTNCLTIMKTETK